jgi:hypothetical protein
MFPGNVAHQWLFDQTTHEHDIRVALGRSGAHDTEAVADGARFVLIGFGAALAARGLGPVEVRSEGQRLLLGGRPEDAASDEASTRARTNELLAGLLQGAEPPAPPEGAEPAAILTASNFELMRALSGRRSYDQIRKLDWSVDPEPYLPAFQFGPFTVSPVDIEE